jgi:hypothetical protein
MPQGSGWRRNIKIELAITALRDLRHPIPILIPIPIRLQNATRTPASTRALPAGFAGEG